MRGLDVFVGDGAADGRLVHADDIGDLGHREGFEERDAALEERDLGFDDLPGDALDRALALLDGVDEKLARAHALAEIVAFLFGERALGDHVAVRVGNSETRDVVAVEVDLPLVSVFFDGYVRNHDAVAVFGETAPGRGVEFADLFDGRLHVVGVGGELARELRDAAAGEQFEMVADHPQGE